MSLMSHQTSEPNPQRALTPITDAAQRLITVKILRPGADAAATKHCQRPAAHLKYKNLSYPGDYQPDAVSPAAQ
jgi:hypothetical protein